MRLLIIALFSITFASCQQDFGKLNIIASLPDSFTEISGIELISGDNNLLWMITDGGNAASVYTYDIQKKKIGAEYKINKATNVDWEDLTSDFKGNLYIGDFGNNKSKREDLKIYKITNIKNAKATQNATTEINFTLSDQTEFPPKKKDLNYDIEAFFYANNNLYLFTRNRSKDFDGTTKMYKLPATPGTHVAELVASYKTCNDSKECQITGAAYHKASKTVALLSYNKVWIIKDFDQDNYLSGNIKEIELGHKSQKESITFKNETTLYFADERNGPDGGNLYEFDFSNEL